jgi:8-oxo-dGTP diphosphatase
MKQIWVAVGVIYDPVQGYFICRRATHQHQGGKWEFPGGKVESNETVEQALARELHEEIGIVVTKASPLLVIEHTYSDKSVKLDVWLVTEFIGLAQSLEGLENRWASVDELVKLDFPDANKPIIDALCKAR